MPVKSYGFAIGNLRAKENTLLKNSDLAQLSSLKNADQLALTLRDKGFGSRAKQEDIPALLRTEGTRLWEYLNEITPDGAVFAPFLMENDFHNLKATLKALIRNTDPTPYLLLPALTEPSVLQKAAAEKKFDLLPEWLRTAAERGYEILTSNGDAQLCDGVIDAACMEAQLSAVGAKDYHCPVAADIIRRTVFFRTVKAALRAARAGKDNAFLEKTLVGTDLVSKSALQKAALGGEKNVLELLSSCGTVGIAAADAFRQSPAAFELYCDNDVMALARRAKLVTLGIEPVIGYYMARRTEMQNIRIIYSGIKTGQPEETIMGRLRELYG